MGTRGAIGFRLHDKDYIFYNHFDSYPSCLGNTMAGFIVEGIKKSSYDDFIALTKQRVLSLVPVEEDAKPTEDQIKVLAEYTNLHVSRQSTEDWYCLLRDTQGEPEKALAARYFVPYDSFLRDGLFCEHAYIINLDTEEIEYYQGFEKWNKTTAKKKNRGRYWAMGPNEGSMSPDYGPVVLKNVTALKDIVSSEAYVAVIAPPEEEAA